MPPMRSALLALLCLSPAQDGPPGLRVEGQKVVDKAGKPVLLRGVSIADPHALGKDFRKEHFERLAREWKANCVRVPVHPGSWKADPARYDAILDQAVEWGRELGLYVIVDYHAIGNPKTGKAQDNKPEYESTMELARRFWKHVPPRHKGKGWVLYEVFNEPMGITWKDLRPLQAELVSLIREGAPESVVIVSGPDWTYDLRGPAEEPVEAPNLLYAWHVYPVRGTTWSAYIARALERFPVVATEWGFNLYGDNTSRGNAEEYALPLLRMMEEKGIHWTAWCWHPKWDPPLLDGWEGVTPSGKLVRAWLNGERPAPRPALKEVNDFTVWLRKLDLVALGASRFDLCVIDPLKEGKEVSRNDIELLKWSAGGPKLVLAWLPVGHADPDRPPWPKEGRADWLGPHDLERRGRYRVKYWEESWHRLVRDQLDKIVVQGFDGAYLDGAEAFLAWEKHEKDERARPRMAGLVSMISDHAKTRRKKGFLVVAQNGELLIENEHFLRAIDGFAREEAYFYRGRQRQAREMIEVENLLDKASRAGKKVFAIEYLSEAEWVTWTYERAKTQGYVPYVTTPERDTLTVHSSHPPD